MDLKKLPTYPYCFVCGTKNVSGLQSQFFIDGEYTLLPVKFTDKHTGYPGYAHGGVVSSAIDETMAWSSARHFKRMCVTAEFTVRFLKRVPLNKDLLVKTWIVKGHRLLAYTEGVLIDIENNEIYVKASGKFMPITEDETQMVDEFLCYDENTERVFL
ncbi:MAG TPA: PaaI family thioesterase [Candidatus Hydrogenedens sp.]|nr:PaaI family thioesterase [Candidatus Hydrogenedens sp.]HOL21019.1 PaaI family thioesterase [Candidatus Hydrogenedens sp.]HPP58302.1 PaaI family thioesterase [Candidatus Hydrogenedens sp.]